MVTYLTLRTSFGSHSTFATHNSVSTWEEFDIAGLLITEKAHHCNYNTYNYYDKTQYYSQWLFSLLYGDEVSISRSLNIGMWFYLAYLTRNGIFFKVAIC